MRRREFIWGLWSAAAVQSAARAQQPSVPVVGFLAAGSPAPLRDQLVAYRGGLREAGYTEGQTVAIEYRWAEGRYDRLSQLAIELLAKQVRVISATGSEAAPLAAKAATSSIPIVFAIGGDPVALGLVATLNRPSGNVTGINFIGTTLEAKRLALLHEVIPQASNFAALVNPRRPTAQYQETELKNEANRLGLQLNVIHASDENEIASAFANLARGHVEALVIAADPYFYSRREELVSLAGRLRIPVIYEWRQFTELGGLLSYGSSLTDAYRQLGIYTGKILSGARPGDLPVVQPTSFELVINLKTATSIGLSVPDSILVRADALIE